MNLASIGRTRFEARLALEEARALYLKIIASRLQSQRLPTCGIPAKP
jgi:hypothetical protein